MAARSAGAEDDGAALGGAAGVSVAAEGGGGVGVAAGGSGVAEVPGVAGTALTGGCEDSVGCASGLVSAGGVAGVLGAACSGAAAGLGSADGAGFGGVAATAILVLYSGGSSRKVYSRTSLPVGQLSSTSSSRNGSLIGCELRMRSTGVEPRRSMVKRTSERIGFASMPA